MCKRCLAPVKAMRPAMLHKGHTPGPAGANSVTASISIRICHCRLHHTPDICNHQKCLSFSRALAIGIMSVSRFLSVSLVHRVLLYSAGLILLGNLSCLHCLELGLVSLHMTVKQLIQNSRADCNRAKAQHPPPFMLSCVQTPPCLAPWPGKMSQADSRFKILVVRTVVPID